MSKQEILKCIDSSDVSKEIKSMVKRFVEEAYSAGFQDGVTASTKIQVQTSELLSKALGFKL